MIYSDDDIQILSRTIYGEARGEPDVGKEAIGHVVINRLKAPGRRFGISVASVCRKPKQFSCWNADDPNEPLLHTVTEADNEVFRDCVAIARRVLSGARDTTRGATHYCTLYSFPDWMYVDPATKLVPRVPTCLIGNHKFFAGVP